MIESEIKRDAANICQHYFDMINEGHMPQIRLAAKNYGLPNDTSGVLLVLIATRYKNLSTTEKNRILLYAKTALSELYGIK